MSLKKALKGSGSVVKKGDIENCVHIYPKRSNYIPTRLIEIMCRFRQETAGGKSFAMPVKYNEKLKKCYIDLFY